MQSPAPSASFGSGQSASRCWRSCARRGGRRADRVPGVRRHCYGGAAGAGRRAAPPARGRRAQRAGDIDPAHGHRERDARLRDHGRRAVLRAGRHQGLANGGEIRLSSRVLAHGLLALGHHPSHVEELRRYAAEHGHLAHSPELRAADAVVFQTATGPGPVSVVGHLGMVAAVQSLSAGACPRPQPAVAAKHRCAASRPTPSPCLYCGIVDDDKAAFVAERLMAPDIFSGWGIRTLSSGSPATTR